ncbi:MAG: pantoate--beta-alanine ligase [Sulfurimonas sp.]|jgi:pantoate--beta-alanine ligase|uniref:pantoate--beta-alanine ligase n=1 Tax=unclassified Sulfurimonas TaxID=2623549 RepID=UPI0008B6B0C9|nr:pantoate--beta-alanine ligase [Sulfurimonas sp. RIFOXYB12_FULL_35_9]MBS4067397.1 pantoate--beta-alanine ligase [Sulfurimonas sp.]OHE11452.1 MAG: pantoate--beta-alanine ligase [Sulfurimonas sp. RIFOXYC2_FULL_36_7]OHE19120.1 MAG: pantoate--beta-alanine ligase [Sulfurimonas sp. RIFOXYD12_FULL_36_11]MDX9756730.1 pantoate--beta-alanine ligase [Sulfurimonas sp.]OHE03760.1 MAG: pantoate--beta-alanine ligase [Sulfurimonas sp. RIFOXYB12_FULL_35_9]
MKIISSPLELKNYLKNYNCSIGFVPTMGALHEGHISLIKKAKEQNEVVVVSIFLNPTQFLKGEDLDKYPKKDEADKKICELSGVDILFFPQVSDMYGVDEVTLLAPKVRGYVLEGSSRPSHFNGVLTVVMKLLNIVNPTRAYFGKKDAQQLNLISLMVKQLFMDVEIVPVDTVREKDALALSSRNVFLTEHQREEALKIPSSLRSATAMVTKGVLGYEEITSNMREILSPLEIFYVEILDREFNRLSKVEIGNTIILVEVKVGNTRLLDNIWL